MARKSAGLGTAITLCAVLALVGCGDDQVADLTADRMASATPDGGALVDSSEKDASGGGLLGKANPAQVRRTYAFESSAAARRAMTELQAEAEKAGWEVRSVTADESGFSAVRPLDGRTATLTVALTLDPAFAPAPGVVVLLTSSED